jgi:DNA repair protein RadC
MDNKIPIQRWQLGDRPREKLIEKGRESLSDAELLGILIGTGYVNMSAVDLGREILSKYENNLNKLARASVKELSKIKGIGPAKAVTIVSALELGRRKNEQVEKIDIITGSKSVYELMHPYLRDLDHEKFYVLYLSRNNGVQKIYHLSKGGVAGTVVDGKLIFKVAFEELASSIVLVHNHPSGNLKPSDADIRITNGIKDMGNLFDIKLLDHIIYTNQSYYSFADDGLL